MLVEGEGAVALLLLLLLLQLLLAMPHVARVFIIAAEEARIVG